MMKLKIALPLMLLTVSAFAANQSDLEKLIQLDKKPSTHVDLSNADLRRYSFSDAKINLQNANLSHSNLSGMVLSKLDMSGADLSYSDLSGAQLEETNLSGANLTHANLKSAQLQNSNLATATLDYADLGSANLQQSNLADASLTCTNLNQANLSQAIFARADISGATFVNTLTAEIRGYSTVVDRKVQCG
jgi:uncharacterized protein YjbI with pentapeptide repeats